MCKVENLRSVKEQYYIYICITFHYSEKPMSMNENERQIVIFFGCQAFHNSDIVMWEQNNRHQENIVS